MILTNKNYKSDKKLSKKAKLFMEYSNIFINKPIKN